MNIEEVSTCDKNASKLVRQHIKRLITVASTNTRLLQECLPKTKILDNMNFKALITKVKCLF